MRTLAAVACVTLILITQTDASPRACGSGDAQGFAAIQADPVDLVGRIPSKFSNRPEFFSRRYNCAGGRVYARRVDLGVYDVQFPGLPSRVPVVSALSQEGVAASVFVFGDIYRVILRGPLIERDVLVRRDVPFTIAIH